MSDTVSDFGLQRLAEWGINGIMGAFDRLAGRIEFIQVRKEKCS